MYYPLRFQDRGIFLARYLLCNKCKTIRHVTNESFEAGQRLEIFIPNWGIDFENSKQIQNDNQCLFIDCYNFIYGFSFEREKRTGCI